MKNIRIFYLKNCHFWVVKFSIYLNRRFFVMTLWRVKEPLVCSDGQQGSDQTVQTQTESWLDAYVWRYTFLHCSPYIELWNNCHLLCLLLVIFKSHFRKQCGPRSDCSFRSSLIWVHTVCRYAKNSFERVARIFSRRHKQTTFSDAVFLGALRVKCSQLKKKLFVLTVWLEFLSAAPLWYYAQMQVHAIWV